MAGIAASGRVRPSTDGAHAKRSGSRYVLGDLLGRGGMAEVFAGYAVGDHGFQKPVAIKRLLPELANDEVFVDRLIEEAKLLVGIQHGHIVSVLDLAREGDDVFLVMEFVDGPSLRQLIKARGSRGLSVGVATYIVQSSAAGLEFAHARPGGAIIHADISPSNLLLTTSGEVRVADFGIARREGLGQGVVEGKWAYMAPEQARGEPLTPRSDVFALGVVLYELLTGQHPFGSMVTANQRDDRMQVIPPRVVKPAVPPGIDAICMRALAHDPRDRYPRMQHLIDALVEERFANGYREGAADLAHAIREVAPRSDIGAPRTMHTERPVTIMTRSLLREAQERAPSQPGLQPPLADQFPAVPTEGVMTRALDQLAVGGEYVPLPSSGEQTMARILGMPDQPPDDLVPSGLQTNARMVDQVALAEAAKAAQALLQVPEPLRAVSPPMPAFRIGYQAGLQNDELASVVGGHTISGQGPGVAAESRGLRWMVAVLGLAAVIGISVAVATQLSPERHADVAAPPAGKLEAAAADNKPSEPPAVLAASGASTSAASASAGLAAADPVATAAAPPAAPSSEPTVPPAASLSASTAQATAAGATDSAAAPTGSDPAGASAAAKPADAPALPTATAAAPSASAPSAGSGDQPAEATLRDAAPAREAAKRAGDSKPVEARPAAPRSSAGRETSRHRGEQGVLMIDTKPWAWATIGVETRETPGKFYLDPGTYIVKLYNQDTGFTKYESVTIEPGKIEKLSISMKKR